MTHIHNRDEKVFDYPMKSNPQTWATSQFSTPGYGIYISNAAESLNSQIEDLRNGSYLNVFVKFAEEVSKQRYNRFCLYREITTPVSIKFQTEYNKVLQEGRRRECFMSSDSVVNVKSNASDIYKIVDLNSRTCSCGAFQEHGKPCLHAAIAINLVNCDFLAFTHPAYTIANLLQTYRTPFLLVAIDNLNGDGITLPPQVVPKRGRPKKRRLRYRGHGVPDELQNQCSGCSIKGHNIRTCVARNRDANQTAPSPQNLTNTVTEAVVEALDPPTRRKRTVVL